MVLSSADDELPILYPIYATPIDLVRFKNVKEKYRINEHIVIEYILDDRIPHSSHNWVGIFPWGATDFEQCITFEWTIISPKDTLSSRQTIEFESKYFASYVQFNQQYQFWFISKRMEILGQSSYFSFVPSEDSTPKTDKISCTKQSLSAQLPEVFVTIPRPCASSVTLSPAQKRQAELQKKHYLKSCSTDTLKEEEITPSKDSKQHTCSLCRQPKNAAHVYENLIAQVKSSAEHARMLKDQLKKLEEALEMSLVSRRVLELATHHAKQEKMAYQKFLNELITSLSEKGTAKIFLGQGKEMILRRVTNESRKHTPKKLSPGEEPLLKAIIGSQERTIQDLHALLDYRHQSPRLNLEVDFRPSVVLANTETEHTENGEDNSLNRTYSVINDSATARDRQQQVLMELAEILARQRLISEQSSVSDWWNTSGNSHVEPTAVLVEANSAKYAIIRF